MKDYLHLIDTQTVGGRSDVTPLFADAAGFSRLLDDLLKPFDRKRLTHVAGVDALGFVLGAGLAVRAKAGFIAIRKEGKLPLSSRSLEHADFVDYMGVWKSLQVRRDSVSPQTRVLVVDDWILTGAQAKAAIALLEKLGAEVMGVAAVAIEENEATQQLREAYFCHTVWPG